MLSKAQRNTQNFCPHQPLGLHGAKEELGSIGSRSSVGHRKNARSGVLECEVLILKLGSVDALASSTVMISEVPSLHD